MTNTEHGARVLRERWAQVVDFYGYEVSDHGRVRSWRPRTGRGAMAKEPRVIKPAANRLGYLHVCLCLNGKVFTRSVHRLVLEAFRGPCTQELEACHNNGVPSDNRVANLRWDTHQSNMDDIAKHGRVARGERHGSRTCPDRFRGPDRGLLAGEKNGRAILTEPVVQQIFLAHDFRSAALIAKTYGASKEAARAIRSGRNWRRVTEGLSP